MHYSYCTWRAPQLLVYRACNACRTFRVGLGLVASRLKLLRDTERKRVGGWRAVAGYHYMMTFTVHYTRCIPLLSLLLLLHKHRKNRRGCRFSLESFRYDNKPRVRSDIPIPSFFPAKSSYIYHYTYYMRRCTCCTWDTCEVYTKHWYSN